MFVSIRIERPLVAADFSLALLAPTPQARSQEMPKSVAEAQHWERANSLPVTALFSTALPAQHTKPGDLLAHEAFGGYALPAGVGAGRIFYHSQDAEGQEVTASAAVLTPAGHPPKERSPVLLVARRI